MIGSDEFSVDSIVFLNNGLNALIQAILLTTIGEKKMPFFPRYG